jgi:hypothetical protein
MTKSDLPPRSAEMCSYALASYAYPIGDDAVKMKDRMQAIMGALGYGALTVVWGGIAPAEALGSSSKWNVALVVVGYRASANEYIVVVRGTNPLSIASWVQEDFDVKAKVPWNPKADLTKAEEGSISNATATALRVHAALSDGGATLLDYLAAAVASTPGATFSFTGHSLGGCMAPVLALKFAESSGVRKEKVSVYAYAGPTPGDFAFKDYMTGVFSLFGTVSFVRDSQDVVPHAWNVKDLDSTKALYEAYPMTDAIKLLLKAVEAMVFADEYFHAYPGFVDLTGLPDLDRASSALTGLASFAEATGAFTASEFRKEVERELAGLGFTFDPLGSLEWFLCAIYMHVYPYLMLCESGTQSVLLEEALKPGYFAGVLGAPSFLASTM